MSRKANYHPPSRTYRSAFELMTERMGCAVIKRAVKRPSLSFMRTLHQRLQAGRPLRTLLPQACEVADALVEWTLCGLWLCWYMRPSGE